MYGTVTGIVDVLHDWNRQYHPLYESEPTYIQENRSQGRCGGDEEEAGFHRQRPTTPLLDSSEQERLDALLSNLSSPDSDLGSLAVQGWRDSPNIKRKRRSAAASRIGTILEEEDDSF